MDTPVAQQHPRERISAFIVCCNEETNIRRCLESVKWCDEIVIVDSGSTDSTLDICREYTSHILHRPWPGFVEQKRFALEQCSHEWCLNLDADEEVSLELRDEMLRTLSWQHSHPLRAPDGYEVSRVVHFLGRWWRKGGWYPEYRLRLCRRSATAWGGEDPHERAEVRGGVARLSGELRHYTYGNLAHQARTLNNFSSAAAVTMFKKGRRSTILAILGNPLARFVKFYLIRKGFLEGFPGLLVAIMESYYVFLKYAKLWELERGEKRTAEQGD